MDLVHLVYVKERTRVPTEIYRVVRRRAGVEHPALYHACLSSEINCLRDALEPGVR